MSYINWMQAWLQSKTYVAEEFQFFSNTFRKHNPTSTLQISTIFNCHGPSTGGCFGGLVVHIETNIALSNG
jgi:hypothetical protein